MKKAIVLSLVAALFAAFSASAEISLPNASFEASLGPKYENNLLQDWTQISDYTTSGHGAVKLYFGPTLELNASIDRNWIRLKESTEPPVDTSYANFGADTVLTSGVDLDELLKGLSTTTIGIHATYIPTGASSRLSLYFTGGVGRREYDKLDIMIGDASTPAEDDSIAVPDFQIYNTTDYDISGAAGYQYSPRVHLRGEIAFNYNDYTNAEYINDMVNSKRTIDLVGGGNWSISGSNVIDLELGLSEQNINRTFVGDTTLADFTVSPPQFYDSSWGGKEDIKVRSLYLSPRYSRGLGERTGVSITGTYRSFISGSDIVAAGDAASLLDPFATVWEGSGVTLSVKTFLIPRLITTFGLGYWDKTYLQHLKGYPVDGQVQLNYVAEDREDEKSSIYFGFQMPLPKNSWGFSIEPALGVEYSDNTSTIDKYDTADWDLSFGISVKR